MAMPVELEDEVEVLVVLEVLMLRRAGEDGSMGRGHAWMCRVGDDGLGGRAHGWVRVSRGSNSEAREQG